LNEESHMLLAVDIGNTNTVMGLFSDDRLMQDWRVRTEVNITIDVELIKAAPAAK